MIENEIEKGFEDLSTVRAYLMAIGAAGTPGAATGLAARFLPNFALNEQKWGVWRPYLIEDEQLEQLCEQYRTLIRDLRVRAVSSTDPLSLQDQVTQAEDEMAKRSREIVGKINKRGW